MRRRRTTLPADSTRWVTPRACRLGACKTRATRSERRRMRRIALGRGEALIAHQADRALMPRLASVLPNCGDASFGMSRSSARAWPTANTGGGPGQPSLLSSGRRSGASSVRDACVATHKGVAPPGSCVVVVVHDGAPAPVPVRREHLLGVVVNWPSVGLTDDFARRAGLCAEYRLTGG